MTRSWTVRATLILAGGLAATMMGACQSATGVRLELSTNVGCERVQGVQVFAGTAGTIEGSAPAAEDRTCLDGALGSIVAQPPGSKTAAASFRVVLGVTRPVAECSARDSYAGCIVQRRELRYIEGETLRLPIVLYERCIGVACDPSSTCASNGLCVNARIEDSATCLPPSLCLPAGDPGTPNVPGPTFDASADGPFTADGPADSSTGDGATSNDSGTDTGAADTGAPDSSAGDAGKDSGIDSGADSGSDAGTGGDGGGTGRVSCGGAQECAVGQHCCTGTFEGSASACFAAVVSCFPAQEHIGRLECDERADCQAGETCCRAGNTVSCAEMMIGCLQENIVCKTSADCGGSACGTLVNIGQVSFKTCGNPP